MTETHLARKKPAKLDLDYQRELVKLKVQHAADVYGHASTYDNVIVILGYAAFFGLWAGVANDVSRLCRTTTAAIMGISLFLYICWQIGQMLDRQRFEGKRFDILVKFEDSPDELLTRLAELAEQRNRDVVHFVDRWWPGVFWATVATGLAGAIILIWNCATAALGLPFQLVG